MTTLVHEPEKQDSITQEEPRGRAWPRRQVERAALLRTAHGELARILSRDSVQFLEQHRQLNGE